MKKSSYRHLLEILEKAIQELPVADSPVMSSGIAHWIESLPFVDVLAADAACVEFAAKKQWPPIEMKILAQVHLRLQAAQEVCAALAAAKEPAPALEERDFLKMLLLDYWRGKGIEWAER